MFLKRAAGFLKAGGLISLIIGSSACVEYTIETTLQSDGSGFRAERMEVSKNDDLSLPPDKFADLMAITDGRGWIHSIEVDTKGDTTNILLRQTRIEDLGAWSDQVDDAVYLTATGPGEANRKVGYVTLGDVRFRNRVEVEPGTVTDGSRSLTYRETFYWEDAIDAIVEMFMSIFSDRLETMYPLLSDHQRGEIVGTARAHLWTAFDEGLLDDWEDRIIYKARDKTTEQAINIVRMRYPQESDFFLRNLLHEVYQGDGEVGEEVERFLEEGLTGLDLALNINIQVRLNMPGTVMNSNHHEVDGTTLVWEFNPLDAAVVPVEIFAESVTGR